MTNGLMVSPPSAGCANSAFPQPSIAESCETKAGRGSQEQYALGSGAQKVPARRSRYGIPVPATMVDADARCVKCVVGGVRILTDGGRSLRAIVRMTDRGLRIGRRAYDSRAEHCACGEGSEEEGAHGDYSRLGSIRRCDGRVVPVSGLEGQRRLWSATARGVPARRTGN